MFINYYLFKSTLHCIRHITITLLAALADKEGKKEGSKQANHENMDSNHYAFTLSSIMACHTSATLTEVKFANTNTSRPIREQNNEPAALHQSSGLYSHNHMN